MAGFKMYAGIFITCEFEKVRKIVKVQKFISETIELEYMDFVFSALASFEILQEEFVGFLNNNDAVIEPAFFIDYVYQFHMHPCFILKLKTKDWLNLDENQAQNISEKSTDRNILTELTLERCNAAIGPDLYVTSDSLKAYISKKSYGDILLVEYERKGTLTDTERRKLISYLCAFVEEHVGFNPTSRELEAASQAFLSLFPCLKSSGRNETELLVNRSNTGYLQIKLKNDRAKRKKLDNSVVLPTISSSPEIFNDSQIEKFQQDLNELQSATFPEQLEFAKEKLRATLKLRRKQVKESGFNVYGNCSYIYTAPELISFDFCLEFKDFSERLLEIWPTLQHHVFTAVKEKGKNILYTEIDREKDWDLSTLSFINLLRLLPPPPNRNKRISRLTDELAVEWIVTFKKPGLTNTELLDNSSNKSPYIVSVGNLKSSISQYLIVLDQHLIPLPGNYPFLNAIDIVFKLHFIFNIEYDRNLRLFWKFIQNYIYKIECAVTAPTKDVYLTLDKLNTSSQ